MPEATNLCPPRSRLPMKRYKKPRVVSTWIELSIPLSPLCTPASQTRMPSPSKTPYSVTSTSLTLTNLPSWISIQHKHLQPTSFQPDGRNKKDQNGKTYLYCADATENDTSATPSNEGIARSQALQSVKLGDRSMDNGHRDWLITLRDGTSVAIDENCIEDFFKPLVPTNAPTGHGATQGVAGKTLADSSESLSFDDMLYNATSLLPGFLTRNTGDSASGMFYPEVNIKVGLSDFKAQSGLYLFQSMWALDDVIREVQRESSDVHREKEWASFVTTTSQDYHEFLEKVEDRHHGNSTEVFSSDPI